MIYIDKSAALNMPALPYPSEWLAERLVENQLAAKRLRNRRALVVALAFLAAAVVGYAIGYVAGMGQVAL